MDSTITEFIGIYDADSTLWGEVSYWIGARLGRTHCSLCDITHGTFRMKQQWRECTGELTVPFNTHHRDDAPTDVLACCNGVFPVVLVRTKGQLRIAISKDELDSFNGSVERLRDRLLNLQS